MKKNYLAIMLFIGVVCLFSSCEKTVKMGYDETINTPILESNIEVSPKENVKAYISKAGASTNSISIYSSAKKSCACAKHGKDCLCHLSNKGLNAHSCGDAKTICKKTKYIEVKVKPEYVDALAGVGFKQLQD